MHQVLAPKWINDIAAQDELARMQSNLTEQETLCASLTVKAEAPGFMRQLFRELALNAEPLSGIGITESLSDSSEPEFETRWRLQVALTGALVPRFTYINIFHLIHESTIRCHTLGGKVFNLHFAVRPEGSAIGLTTDSSLSLMNPEQSAQFIVKPMVDWIRSRASKIY